MKLYADRDAQDLEPLFSMHMSAMTGENLHSKSDIACELAVRDIEIERLRQRVKELEDEAERAGAVVLNINAEKLRLEKELAALKQAQSEPYGYICDDDSMYQGSFSRDDIWTKSIPLYTSASTILEGLMVKYKELRRHERHNTLAETLYWLNQYKVFIESMLAAPKLEDK